MQHLKRVSGRHIFFVLMYSVIVLVAIGGYRTTHLIDFYIPRTALLIENFNTRQSVAVEQMHELNVTTNSPNFYTAPIGDLAALKLRSIVLELGSLPTTLDRRLVVVAIDGKRVSEVNNNISKSKFEVIIPPHIHIDSNSNIQIFTIPDKSTTPPDLTITSLSVGEANIYRWSQSKSTFKFNGVGGGWWIANVKLTMQHPNSKPFAAYLQIGTRKYAEFPTNRIGFRNYEYLVDPDQIPTGNVHIDIFSELANTPNDIRKLGVPVMMASLQPLIPNWYPLGIPLQVMAVIIISLLATVSMMIIRPQLWFIGLIIASTLAVLTVFDRIYITGWYLQLLILFIVTTLSIPLWYKLLDWMLTRTPKVTQFNDMIVFIVVLSIWIKAGGILFPYMVPIDISWHMDKVREIINTWDFAKYYMPGSFSESVMPITEWGAERPMIPYSPFYHFFSIVFMITPWSLETNAMMVSVFMDVSRIIFIAVIARHSGLSTRISFLAGLIYAITPMTFLLHSWGNTPTTTGMWWTLLSTTLIFMWGENLQNKRYFAIITMVSVITMLIYTVTAVFHILFISFLAILMYVYPKTLGKFSAKYMVIATFTGLAIATLMYYGQYIEPIFERTIPYFLQLSVNGAESVGVERPSFFTYLINYCSLLHYSLEINTYLYYGLLVPMLLVVPGFLLLKNKHLLWVFMSAWFVVAIVFMLVGTRISMVDKQIIYILPVVAICTAYMVDQFWRRGVSGKIFTIIILIYTLFSALQLWVFRIENSPVRWS